MKPSEVIRYSISGCSCPNCGSDNISGDSWDANGGFAFQEVSCNDCGYDWQDFYQLIGITLLRDEKGNEVHKQNDGDDSIDFRDIVLRLVKNKKLLPILLHAHPKLDRIIEEKLKK